MNKYKNMYVILIIGILLIIGVFNIIIPSINSGDGVTNKSNFSNSTNFSKSFIHPNMYINTNDIISIKKKVVSNQQPWKAAYDKLIVDANNASNIPIQSVTFGGKIPPSGNKHDYFSQEPYLTDGVYDPDADRTDYTSARNMRDSVRSLGLAYAFTGEDKYAEKVIQLIKAWTINPDTKLNPKFTNSQSQIELSITMPGVFYGVDLIWNYPGFNSSDKAAFQSWVSQFIGDAKKFSSEENFDLWRLTFISSGAVITEDENNLQYVFDRWRYDIDNQTDKQGKIIRELHRTTSLSYSLSGVNGFIITAELAMHRGVDLYNYTSSDGKGLQSILDFHTPYVINPSTWKYQQIRPYAGQSAGLYELAYSWKKKDSYKKAIDKWGRPMYEDRVLGPVTLTHAN